MAQSPTKSCAVCDKPATSYCYEDKLFLCSQCRKDIHDRVTVCRDHNVVDIHKAGNRIYKPVPVCDSHKKEFLYYCSKCDCLACKECMTGSHNGHITKEIKSITDIYRQELDEIINKMKTKVEGRKKTLETIDGEHSLLIQSGCDSYIKDVEKTSEEINQIVKRYKDIEVTTAINFRDTETLNLKETRVSFQRLYNASSDRLLKFKNLLQEPHNNTFFLEWKGLQNEYKIMTEESEQPLSSPRQMSGLTQDTFRRAIFDGIDKQFKMGLKELETAVSVLEEEVNTLNEKLKGKQEEIDSLSELSQELQLKEEKETLLFEEINKLKTEIKDKNREFAFLSRELELKKKREIEVLDDNNKLKTEIKERNTREISFLSRELELKKKREIELLDDNNKLKTKIKERHTREIALQSHIQEQETTVARLTNEMDVLKHNLIVQQRHTDTWRIVLIGCDGVGKSSLGNTLLGEEYFEASSVFNRFKSATSKCEIAVRKVGDRRIMVADTPPIINSDGKNMISALAHFIDLLAPGPHAIIIVIHSNRPKDDEERRAIGLLFDFFGDNKFLDFTLLVMVGKDDLFRKFGKSNNIHDFVENKSPQAIKQLYEKCNKRIVAVENMQNMSDRQKDAENVLKEIEKLQNRLGAYYSNYRYFQKDSSNMCKQM